MLTAAKHKPSNFPQLAGELFGAMAAQGGRIGFTDIPWFNGGLFDDNAALPLEEDDIALLQRVTALDWAEIDPSIFGTLFERGLDPDKRSQLGAHYTIWEKIEKLIDPVIRRPLVAEWAVTKGHIETAQATQGTTKRRSRRDGQPAGTSELRAFLDRLRAYRVLDPACGSGNFLYLALLALKDLEHQVMVEAETLGLQREFPQIGPEAVFGIEINLYAAELARVSVWIGHIQWARRHGVPSSADPHTEEARSHRMPRRGAHPDGTPSAWPKANAIIGNPPFLGGKLMRRTLGGQFSMRCSGPIPTAFPPKLTWYAIGLSARANS